MLKRIIDYSFYLLFFLVPLFFSPSTNELFEFNKMFLTYSLTALIVTAWISRMIMSKTLAIKGITFRHSALTFLP
jgi:putative inorganic carbon (hco3(-)) transporter